MMYMVSYDLMAPEGQHDYQRLFAQLEELGFHRLMYSQWVARWVAPTSAAQIRDIIWPLMDANDRLFVTCLDNSDWAGYNLLLNPNTLRP